MDIFEKRILLETSEPHYKLDVSSPPPTPLIPPHSSSLTLLFSSLPFSPFPYLLLLSLSLNPLSLLLLSTSLLPPPPSLTPPPSTCIPSHKPDIASSSLSSSITPHHSWLCPTQLKRRKPEQSSTRRRKLSQSHCQWYHCRPHPLP